MPFFLKIFFKRCRNFLYKTVYSALLLPKHFEWQRYLALNPDLTQNGISTKKAAIYHYLQHGRKENRIYSEKHCSNRSSNNNSAQLQSNYCILFINEANAYSTSSTSFYNYIADVAKSQAFQHITLLENSANNQAKSYFKNLDIKILDYNNSPIELETLCHSLNPVVIYANVSSNALKTILQQPQLNYKNIFHTHENKKMLLQAHPKAGKQNNDVILFSVFHQAMKPDDFTFFINIINQYIIRNNYRFDLVLVITIEKQLTADELELYQKFLNVKKIIYKDNRGFDIGGLLMGLRYLSQFGQYQNGHITYVHSKKNILWRKFLTSILYNDLFMNYDTTVNESYFNPCSLIDLNRKTFARHDFLAHLKNKKFNYIQGTIFTTQFKHLQPLIDNYDYLYTNLTSLETNDIYWQSLMKNRPLFRKYQKNLVHNIYNDPIPINSVEIMEKYKVKNYLELLHEYNTKGIPDGQFEHALERYIGYLVSKKPLKVQLVNINKIETLVNS